MLLPFRTDVPFSGEIIEDLYEKDDLLTVEEFYPGDEKYLSEKILFFENASADSSFKHKDYLPPVTRKDSLYWQLPVTLESADEFVSAKLVPFLKKNKELKAFFIYYASPEIHIRLRIVGVKNKDQTRKILEKVFTKWQKEKWIGLPRERQYFPEVFSYGGAAGISSYEKYSILDNRLFGITDTSKYTLAVMSALVNAHTCFKTLAEAKGALENLIQKMAKVSEPRAIDKSFLTELGNYLVSSQGSVEPLISDFHSFAKERKKIWESINQKISSGYIKQEQIYFFEKLTHLSNNRIGLSHGKKFELSVYITTLRAIEKLMHFQKRMF
jgi:thiopeptide-type bacteriocin biosynthesis protein